MTPSPETRYRGLEVLVTGGLGFIGSNLSIRLAREGARVTVVDSLDAACGGNPFNIEPVRSMVDLRTGSVGDAALIEDLVRGKDIVFHLAGHISHVQSMEDPSNDMSINLGTTIALLEACRRVNRQIRVVYGSTRQIYGRAQRLPVSEGHPVRPIDVNGVTKAAAERLHQVYDEVYGIRAVSLRLVNTYGPRMLVRHPRLGFIGWFIHVALEGGEIEIFGGGEQLRDFNFIDDAVDALMLAGSTESVFSKVFNLGGIAPMGVREFAQTLIAVAGTGSCRTAPFPPARKAIDIGSIYCDYSSFTEATGWRPQVDVKEGIGRTIEYYRRHRERYR